MSFELVRLIRQVLREEVAPLEAAVSDGVVENVEGSKASVRIGGNTLATPGFTFPPSLDVQAGDHVQLYRLGGYQLILLVLNRNATVGGDTSTTTSGGRAFGFFA